MELYNSVFFRRHFMTKTENKDRTKTKAGSPRVLSLIRNCVAALLLAVALAACTDGEVIIKEVAAVTKQEKNPDVLKVIVTTPEVIIGRGSSLELRAEVVVENGAGRGVDWAIDNPPSGCVIQESGNIVIAQDAPLGDFTVTASSSFDPSKQGTARVTVVDGRPLVQSVAITPGMVTARHGDTLRFDAAVTGSTEDTGVIWEVSGSAEGSGTVIEEGVLTIGGNETGSLLTVTARSRADGRVSGLVPVILATVSDVTLTPGEAKAAKGGVVRFHAAVSGFALGAEERLLEWTLADAEGNPLVSGSRIEPDEADNTKAVVTVGGNETAETLVVTARSVYDGRYLAVAEVTVSAVQAVLGYVETAKANGTTNKLTLFFDREIPGLTKDIIQITPADSGVTKGTFSRLAGTSGVYELLVTSSKPVEITIGVNKADYVVAPYGPVPVEYQAPVTFLGVTATEKINDTTSKLRLSFDKDITNTLIGDSLAVDEIQFAANGTGTTRGTLTKASGTGQYDLTVSGITKSGTVGITINRDVPLINNPVKTVDVAYALPMTLNDMVTSEDENGTTDRLRLIFNADLPENLLVSDVTLTNGTGIAAITNGTTTLTKVSGRIGAYELPVTVTQAGTMTVKVSKAGFFFSVNSQTATAAYTPPIYLEYAIPYAIWPAYGNYKYTFQNVILKFSRPIPGGLSPNNIKLGGTSGGWSFEFDKNAVVENHFLLSDTHYIFIGVTGSLTSKEAWTTVTVSKSVPGQFFITPSRSFRPIQSEDFELVPREAGLVQGFIEHQ
jgi:hypothetical protein